MLPQTQIKNLKNLLGIKNEKNAVLFLARLEGWIKANGNTKLALAKGLNSILKDIHYQEIKSAKELKKINLEGVKNPILLKYGKQIIELKLQGLGVRRIEKWLWETHRAKISYATIYNFLKHQKEVENG